MDVLSTTARPVASLVWQPRPGAWVLTVVSKATYLLRPGECPPAPVQEPIIEDDRHLGDDPARSLKAPRDLVPAKPGADVILVGSVFAPERRPTRAVVARLAVGDLERTVEAVVDRTLRPDGSVREGPLFTAMPLLYERAAGGPGTWNPVGMRRDVRNGEGGVALPNLQRPGALGVGVWEPVGLGPIAPSWPERRERLGAAGAAFSFRDLSQRPLPDGMDLAFFNAAPRDQQLRALGEVLRLMLENLHPDHPRLVTTVSASPPRAVLEGRREGPLAITLRGDTLWIDTDRGICTVTFRGMVPLQGADERGRVVVSAEGDGTQVRPAVEVGELTGVTRVPRKFEITADVPLEIRLGGKPKATLPFAHPSPASTPAPTSAAPSHGGDPLLSTLGGAPGQARLLLDPPPARAEVSPSPWAAGSAPSPVAPGVSLAPRAAAPSAYEASAAALGARPLAVPDPVKAPEPPRPAAPSAVRAESLEAVELVWFDPEGVPRLRRKPEWRPLLDDLERSPLDPETDDPAFAKDPMDIEDRREVFAILAHAPALDPGDLDATVAHCLRADGRFVPALGLLMGELELPFDELATLRATLTTVAPIAGADEALKATLQAAKDFLAMPGLMSAPAVAEGLTRRIEEAFAAGKRVVPSGYLESHRERALLEHRQYQRRALFGGKHLRGLLRLGGAEPSAKTGSTGKGSPASPAVLPLYLPEAVADELPLAPRFRVRVVAELRLAADRYEAHPAAGRALALARLSPPLPRA